MTTRLISFGNSTVTIDYLGDVAAEIVQFLFSHVSFNQLAESHQTIHLISDEQTGEVRVQINQQTFYRGIQKGAAAGILLGKTLYHLADKVNNGMVFHAAGVVKNGVAFMLPGTMGAGKTTLTAWLLSQGFSYLTDELVLVENGASNILGFTRPLNLKLPAIPILESFCSYDLNDHPVVPTMDGCLIPFHLLNPAPPVLQAPLKAVFFPSYNAESRGKISSLTPARTALHLMKSLLNARNLPQDGFTMAVALSKKIQGFHLEYSHFCQIEPVFSKIFT